MGLEELILQIVREEAKLEREHLFVTNLLQQTDFPNEKIASLVDVDVAFVRNIKTELGLK